VTETQMLGMASTSVSRTSRTERMAMPLARDVLRDLAVEQGACICPIQLRRTNQETGETDTVLVPCGKHLRGPGHRGSPAYLGPSAG
jgi:hypothetical protein